jgi:hypothetical protein
MNGAARVYILAEGRVLMGATVSLLSVESRCQGVCITVSEQHEGL